VLAGELRQQHHADEKEINVGAFCGRLPREPKRNQPQNQQQQRATANPVDLCNVAGTNQHQQDAKGDDEG
jgi:hypothetical protein